MNNNLFSFTSLICLWRFISRSLSQGCLVSGHAYRTIAEETPPNIHVLKCEACGHTNVGWSWESLEDSK